MLLVQVFLINKEYQRSESRFDQNVQIALQNVRNSFLSQNINEVFSTQLDTSIGNANSYISVRVIASSDDDTTHLETQIDHRIEVKQTISDTSHKIIRNESLTHISSEITDKLIRDILTPQITSSIVSKLNKINLDTTIRQQLDALGLSNDFLYQVVSGDSVLHPITFLVSKVYNVDLFPIKLNPFGAILQVQIVNRKNSILQTLLIPLSLSFLVLLLSAVLFIYLFALYKTQKKVTEARDDFINSMSHELKTPIATIQLSLENLKDHMPNDYLTIIKDENQRMLHYIDNILQMAALENQVFQLDKKIINLSLLIPEVLQRLDIQIQESTAIVTSRLQENLFLSCDRTHLTNVLVNLIDNSLKYASRIPTIQVLLKQTDTEIVLTISDNGCGMKASDLLYIFDPFYRIQHNNIYTSKGTGLGLSYSKKIIEAHGGTITASSTINEGSTFTITFPK